jgi:signal transduction histidine kinase
LTARAGYLTVSRAEIAALNDGTRHDERLHGRLAAVFFTGSGVLGLVTLPIPAPGLNVPAIAAISSVAIAVGVATWFVPWRSWPRRASLGLVPPAFALIALTVTYGGADFQAYGVFLLVSFVWIGISQAPRTSVAAAPLAIAAYLLPLSFMHADFKAGIYSASLTIPECVLVGEGIAWFLTRLERMENALRREISKTESLRELDEMKDEFISTVSHELRTPITICRGHLDVLGPGTDEKEVRTVKETIVNELDLMARLVDDLATLARLDDRSQLRMETLPLADFMSSIAKQAAPILGHRLQVENGVLGAMLRADPQRLTQALLNLLRNAAEHTQGDRPVRFRVRPVSSSWRFEVADEGGGLAPADEHVVFEPFKTGSSPTAGTGLGLSIVREVARAHRGEYGLVNRPGQGATFWIAIPWSTS